jgi:hypothetical protein
MASRNYADRDEKALRSGSLSKRADWAMSRLLSLSGFPLHQMHRLVLAQARVNRVLQQSLARRSQVRASATSFGRLNKISQLNSQLTFLF